MRTWRRDKQHMYSTTAKRNWSSSSGGERKHHLECGEQLRGSLLMEAEVNSCGLPERGACLDCDWFLLYLATSLSVIIVELVTLNFKVLIPIHIISVFLYFIIFVYITLYVRAYMLSCVCVCACIFFVFSCVWMCKICVNLKLRDYMWAQTYTESLSRYRIWCSSESTCVSEEKHCSCKCSSH